MSVNRGKEAFLKIPGVSIDRLNDNTAGFKGIAGICDFIVYKMPYEYYIECKSVHGNTLPFSNITDKQWNGMLEKFNILGVNAGVICWFIDHDRTIYIPISELQFRKDKGEKSIRYDVDCYTITDIRGTKKRVFYEYDMNSFFQALAQLEEEHRR